MTKKLVGIIHINERENKMTGKKKEMSFGDFLNVLELYGRSVLKIKHENPDLNDEQVLVLSRMIIKTMAEFKGIE